MIARPLIRALAAILEPDPAVPAEPVGPHDPEAWGRWRRAIVGHGLVGHVARGPLMDTLPSAEVAWLREHDRRNARRIDRLHDDLARILGAAASRGIEVMPLKGAVLTTLPGEDPHRRPMADLDLLVRPPDRAALRSALEDLGYRHEPEDAPRPTHDVFVDPGGGRIVAPDGEHEDNPRRVEVHTEVKRHLWGWVDDDDLTAALWRSGTHCAIVGRTATVPSPEMLFVHLAIHATSDQLVGRGRLVAWVDLARLASIVAWPTDAVHPRIAYPSLRLARRALPQAMAPLDLTALEAHMPPRLVAWAASVPLDDRCGLTRGRPPDRPASAAARWERWRPEPWRLAVAYGALPVPFALARHAAVVGRLGARAATRRGVSLAGRVRSRSAYRTAR